jgi:hypothetical protein
MDNNIVSGRTAVVTDYFSKSADQVNDAGTVSLTNWWDKYDENIDLTGKFLIPTWAAVYFSDPGVRTGIRPDSFSKYFEDILRIKYRSVTIFKRYVLANMRKLDKLPDFIIVNCEEKSIIPYVYGTDIPLYVYRHDVLIKTLEPIGTIDKWFASDDFEDKKKAAKATREWLRCMVSGKALHS